MYRENAKQRQTGGASSNRVCALRLKLYMQDRRRNRCLDITRYERSWMWAGGTDKADQLNTWSWLERGERDGWRIGISERPVPHRAHVSQYVRRFGLFERLTALV